MKNEIVLGLDMSLNGTGLCVRCGDKILIVETIKIKKERGMERINIIINHIKKRIEEYKPTRVFIEGYSFGSRGRSIISLGELGGIVRYVLAEMGLKPVEIAPKSLKKITTGNGNADKVIMLESVNKKFNLLLTDHNQADALALSFVEEISSLPLNALESSLEDISLV